MGTGQDSDVASAVSLEFKRAATGTTGTLDIVVGTTAAGTAEERGNFAVAVNRARVDNAPADGTSRTEAAIRTASCYPLAVVTTGVIGGSATALATAADTATSGTGVIVRTSAFSAPQDAVAASSAPGIAVSPVGHEVCADGDVPVVLGLEGKGIGAGQDDRNRRADVDTVVDELRLFVGDVVALGVGPGVLV